MLAYNFDLRHAMKKKFQITVTFYSAQNAGINVSHPRQEMAKLNLQRKFTQI